MESIKSTFFIFIMLIGLTWAALILRDQSFYYDRALELRSEAIDICMADDQSQNPDVYFYNIDQCQKVNDIENFHITLFDYFILFFFGLPVLVGIGTMIVVGISLKSDQLKEKNTIVPGIGKGGRERIDRRSEYEQDHFKKRFVLGLDNVNDIIKKNHFTKADYKDWFYFTAEIYIDEYPQHIQKCTPDDLIKKLIWARDLIPVLYKETENAGKNHYKKLDLFIKKIEILRDL